MCFGEIKCHEINKQRRLDLTPSNNGRTLVIVEIMHIPAFWPPFRRLQCIILPKICYGLDCIWGLKFWVAMG